MSVYRGLRTELEVGNSSRTASPPLQELMAQATMTRRKPARNASSSSATAWARCPARKAGWDGYVVQASPIIKELGPHLDRQAGVGKLGGQTGHKSVSQQQGEQGYSHQPG